MQPGIQTHIQPHAPTCSNSNSSSNIQTDTFIRLLYTYVHVHTYRKENTATRSYMFVHTTYVHTMLCKMFQQEISIYFISLQMHFDPDLIYIELQQYPTSSSSLNQRILVKAPIQKFILN